MGVPRVKSQSARQEVKKIWAGVLERLAGPKLPEKGPLTGSRANDDWQNHDVADDAGKKIRGKEIR